MANMDDDEGWNYVSKPKKAPIPSLEDKLLDIGKNLGAAQDCVPHLKEKAKQELRIKEWEVRPQSPIEGDKTPTVCYFLEPTQEKKDQFKAHMARSESSADGALLKELRTKVGISNKQTICAEENFATTHPNLIQKCLYSIAFDKYGPKASCSNCFKILYEYGVEDLGRKKSK